MVMSGNVKTHEDDPILTFSEAARLIGRHRSTIQRWVDQGKIKSMTLPGSRRAVRRSEIDKILMQEEVAC